MPSFKIIGLLVLEKNFFKVFTIYGHGGHLGHVTWTFYINFIDAGSMGILQARLVSLTAQVSNGSGELIKSYNYMVHFSKIAK